MYIHAIGPYGTMILVQFLILMGPALVALGYNLRLERHEDSLGIRRHDDGTSVMPLRSEWTDDEQLAA